MSIPLNLYTLGIQFQDLAHTSNIKVLFVSSGSPEEKK